METKQIMSLALAIAIGALVFSAALIPAISMATDTEDTFVNEGYFYVDNPADSVNIVLADGELTVNGEDVNPPENTTYPDGITILIADNCIIRYYESELRSRGGILGYHSMSACDLTFSDGAITGTYTEGETTATVSDKSYTDLTIISASPTDNVMCKPVPQYVKIDSEIRGAGVINTPTQSTKYWVCEWNGSIEDGITVNLYGQSTGVIPESTTATNIEVNYSEVDGYVGLYRVSSVTFDIVGAVEGEDAVTFTNYIAPAEVTAELAYHADGPTRAILNIIPIIAVLGLLIGIVTIGYIKFRN